MYVIVNDAPLLWSIEIPATVKLIVSAFSHEAAATLVRNELKHNTLLSRTWNHGYKRELTVACDKSAEFVTRSIGPDTTLKKEQKSRFYSIEPSCPVCNALVEDCTCREAQARATTRPPRLRRQQAPGTLATGTAGIVWNDATGRLIPWRVIEENLGVELTGGLRADIIAAIRDAGGTFNLFAITRAAAEMLGIRNPYDPPEEEDEEEDHWFDEDLAEGEVAAPTEAALNTLVPDHFMGLPVPDEIRRRIEDAVPDEDRGQ